MYISKKRLFVYLCIALAVAAYFHFSRPSFDTLLKPAEPLPMTADLYFHSGNAKLNYISAAYHFDGTKLKKNRTAYDTDLVGFFPKENTNTSGSPYGQLLFYEKTANGTFRIYDPTHDGDIFAVRELNGKTQEYSIPKKAPFAALLDLQLSATHMYLLCHYDQTDTLTVHAVQLSDGTQTEYSLCLSDLDLTVQMLESQAILFDPRDTRLVFLYSFYTDRYLGCFNFLDNTFYSFKHERKPSYILFNANGYYLADTSMASRVRLYPYDLHWNAGDLLEITLYSTPEEVRALGKLTTYFQKTSLYLVDGKLYGTVTGEDAAWFYVADVSTAKVLALCKILPPDDLFLWNFQVSDSDGCQPYRIS